MRNKMKCRQEDPRDSSLQKTKRKHGPTSTHLHSPETVFKEIKILNGDIFLDIGCGIGEYSMFASNLVGEAGKIYSLDINEVVIENLQNEIRDKGIYNMEAFVADITEIIPLEDQSVDICFMVTVLHSINLSEYEEKIFNEIRRVLKPNGRLITIDCKKELSHFGPPAHLRISEKELIDMAAKYSFKNTNYTDLTYNYMLQFDVLKP